MSQPSRRAFLAGVMAAMPAVSLAEETPPEPRPAVPNPTPAPASTPPTARPPPPAIDRTKQYYVFFDQAIDLATARALRRQLATLVEAGVTDITLALNSPGGFVEQSLVTYSFIRALPATIHTHAQGLVASAANLLMLAGETRTADRNARFLFHPSTVVVNAVLNQDQMRDRATWSDVVEQQVEQIYHDRTRLTDPDIARFGHEEVFYTSDQALERGIVQTVADLRIPGDQKARILFMD